MGSGCVNCVLWMLFEVNTNVFGAKISVDLNNGNGRENQSEWEKKITENFKMMTVDGYERRGVAFKGSR